MTTPVDPGPLVMGGTINDRVVALDQIDGSTDSPNSGVIADMDTFRPNWRGYAAWLVRASNEYTVLVDAATAGLAYDKAMFPADMTKYQTMQGDTLDTLYEKWVGLCREALEPVDDSVLGKQEQIEELQLKLTKRVIDTEVARSKVTTLRTALVRLGSSEAMTHSFVIDKSPTGKELQARLQYARDQIEALSATPPAVPT